MGRGGYDLTGDKNGVIEEHWKKNADEKEKAEEAVMAAEIARARKNKRAIPNWAKKQGPQVQKPGEDGSTKEGDGKQTARKPTPGSST